MPMDPWSDITARLSLCDLRPQWMGLLASLGVEAAPAKRTFDDLVTAYTAPHRHYHTLDHICQVLAVLRGWRLDTRSTTGLSLAAWFHDAVYDPRRQDNEERSAELAEGRLSLLRVAPEVVADVRRLVLLTRGHQSDGTLTGDAFIDADLAILGAPVDVYRDYSQAIRQEYVWVPDEAYRTGRRRVLESFLRRPSLYLTPDVRRLLESQARQNLAWELGSLG